MQGRAAPPASRGGRSRQHAGVREASGLGALSYRKEFEPPSRITAGRLKELARATAPDAWILVKIGHASS